MDLVSDKPSQVAMTITITRAATGLTETINLVGDIVDVVDTTDDGETLIEEQS